MNRGFAFARFATHDSPSIFLILSEAPRPSLWAQGEQKSLRVHAEAVKTYKVICLENPPK